MTRNLPGVIVAAAVMVGGFWLADLLGHAMLAAQDLTGSSPISGVPVAIVVGLLLRNTLPLPAALTPGLKFATTNVLRLGIVLVGIRLSVFDVLKLGLAGLPVVIAAIVITIMTTWRAGKREFDRLHYAQEGSLSDFIEEIRDEQIPRVPGLAVFPHRNSDTTPLALRHNVDFNGVVHQHVVLVTMIYVDAPHVRHVDRIRVNDLGYADDGIVHFTCRVGFTDSQDIPKALRLAIGQAPELSSLSEEDAYYFLSVTTLNHPRVRTLATWRKQLYVWLAHNSSSGVQVFHLPTDRTIVMGSHVEL